MRGLAALIGGLLALTACVVEVPHSVPPAWQGRIDPASVTIEDRRGPLGPKATAEALRRLDREGEAGLLSLHLAQIEGAVSSPLVLGNQARLLVDGPATQQAMLEAIAAARESIELESYIIEATGMGERLPALLRAKRESGVRVRVLYDSVGSVATPAEYFEQLHASGVEVCEFNPVNPLRLRVERRLSINNRDHRKLLIVDGSVAFTGGINISGVYSSSSFGRKRNREPSRESGWRDTHVAVRGPVVNQFRELFDAAWRGQHCPQAEVAGPAFRPASAGSMAVRLIAADPLAERSELYVALLSAMSHARQRIWLTYGYFVPDEGVLQALQAAAARGVDVRLMLPGFSDFWAPFHAGRSHYSRLLDAGVRIYERRDALLHAKTAVIDGVWSSVGSTNLDWRSFVHNYEADLMVLDREFGSQMEDLFMLDQSAAHEIGPREWDERGIGQRLLEWLARPWAYLL